MSMYTPTVVHVYVKNNNKTLKLLIFYYSMLMRLC